MARTGWFLLPTAALRIRPTGGRRTSTFLDLAGGLQQHPETGADQLLI